jgi:hypothetical protein
MEGVAFCNDFARFVGETLAPSLEGDSTRRLLVGVSGNRVSSRSSMVLREKATARFSVMGFAGVTSCDLVFMADLDGDFCGEVEGRVRSFEGALEDEISCSRDLIRLATTSQSLSRAFMIVLKAGRGTPWFAQSDFSCIP